MRSRQSSLAIAGTLDDSWVSRFRGAAKSYARYRPGYPPAVFDTLRRRYELGADSRVLDLASGTGLVALPLAEIVGEVVALDADDEMLGELRAVAPPNVTTVLALAEDVGPALGRFRLTTIGRAFHWLDRDVVLHALHPISDGVAILGESLTPGEPWETLVQIAAEHAGDRRPEHSGESWADVIARSPYGSSEELHFDVERHWTLDEVVGYASSLSWASRSVLGDRWDAFERELRERLGPGPWVEHARFELFLA
jgi:SAM-dependent methyltransferase